MYTYHIHQRYIIYRFEDDCQIVYTSICVTSEDYTITAICYTQPKYEIASKATYITHAAQNSTTAIATELLSQFWHKIQFKVLCAEQHPAAGARILS